MINPTTKREFRRIGLPAANLNDIVIDPELLKAKRTCNQQIRALRDAELAQILLKQEKQK